MATSCSMVPARSSHSSPNAHGFAPVTQRTGSSTYARNETGLDLRTLATPAKGLATDDFGARDVMVSMTQSAAFSHLPSRE